MRSVFYQIAFLILLGTAGTVGAGPVSLLPNYEREARMVFQGSCDGGKISYSTYHKVGGYILEVARIQSEGLFYFMKRYLGAATGWEERYFVRMTDYSHPAEFSHEEWDEKVKKASVNYFNKLHDLETTCSKVLVM